MTSSYFVESIVVILLTILTVFECSSFVHLKGFCKILNEIISKILNKIITQKPGFYLFPIKYISNMPTDIENNCIWW